MSSKSDLVEYAGFWRRLSAHLIDLLVSLPLLGLVAYYLKFRLFYLYSFVPLIVIGLFLNVYLVKRFGGTPGKLLVKTKVQRVDGLPMDYSTAIIRHWVLFTLTMLQSWALVIGSLAMTDSEYNALTLVQKSAEVVKHAPYWYSLVKVALNLWILSEFIFILTNKKRRAIHDFMAGTVVVRCSKKSN